MPVAQPVRRVLACAAFVAVSTAWSSELQAEDRGLSKSTVELSTAASFTSSKDEGGDENFTVLNLPVRAGVFLTRSLSAEGELGLSRVSYGGNSSTGVLFSGSMLYHLRPAARTTPFLIAGAGIGNGFEYLGVVADSDTTVKTLHAGGGIKARIGDSAAFRVEYRFTHATAGRDSNFVLGGGSALNNHRVLIGLSIFVH